MYPCRASASDSICDWHASHFALYSMSSLPFLFQNTHNRIRIRGREHSCGQKNLVRIETFNTRNAISSLPLLIIFGADLGGGDWRVLFFCFPSLSLSLFLSLTRPSRHPIAIIDNTYTGRPVTMVAGLPRLGSRFTVENTPSLY